MDLPIREAEKNLVVGEHEIRIRMTQDRKNTYMGTGFSSSIPNWNSDTGSPYPDHPKFKETVQKINRLTDDIDFEIKLSEKAGRVITPVEIKTTLTNRNKIHFTSEKPKTIMAYQTGSEFNRTEV